jgi:hypothetical protein
MFVDGPIADCAYSACEFLINRGHAACQRAGARLVVVTIPHPLQLTPRGLESLAAMSGAESRFDGNLPDRRIAGICHSLQVSFVSGRTRLSRRDYKRREGIHWNERGHRRIANLLQELVAGYRSGALDAHVPRKPLGAVLPLAYPSEVPAASALSATGQGGSHVMGR